MCTCDRCKKKIPEHLFIFEVDVKAIDHTGYEANVRNNKFCPNCYNKILNVIRGR